MGVALLVAAGIALTACGSSSSSSTTSARTTPAAAAATNTRTSGGSTSTRTGAAAAAGAETKLALAADPSGAFKYDKSTLTAKAGKVEITFTNASPVPHDVAIKGNGVNAGPTEQISGGGTADLTATLQPGTYEFYCTVPGHEQAGMKGTLTVT
jgi:plastocyanin